MERDDIERKALALVKRMSAVMDGHENAIVGVALMTIIDGMLTAAAQRSHDEYLDLYDCFQDSLLTIKEDLEGGPYGRTH